ncbi:MAG: AAA family ATPase [Syntrophorhabdaceae bacterium]|nr:AAA family ATPase [Syntrophorhabdaceae bacterium]
MIEPYLKYWGLEKHPFLLAPDSNMMYMAGQYFECFERLKYAVATQKGGVLIVSEDAGLGKTTILLKLIDELKQKYNDTFRYAFIDHPTMNPSQIISFITKEILGVSHYDDKLKNIIALKDALIELKTRGGKAIIIVDEAQLLCGKNDILQELRILINLNYENEYLHTFILSGQKPLWDEIKNLPEFWQRLPVKYYFMPLRVDETKELIKFRLNNAGLNTERRIFTDDALELIHRHAKGSPRTIIALADMALLAGYADRAGIIGFKEIQKALDMMSGKGESLPYIVPEKARERTVSTDGVKTPFKNIKMSANKYEETKNTSETQTRPFFIILAFLFFMLLGGVAYHYLMPTKENNSTKHKAENTRPVNVKDSQISEKEKVGAKDLNYTLTDENLTANLRTKAYERELLVTKPVVNIRSAPDITAPRIAMIFQGEILKAKEEKRDSAGNVWYKVPLYGDKEGWVSEIVVRVR